MRITNTSLEQNKVVRSWEHVTMKETNQHEFYVSWEKCAEAIELTNIDYTVRRWTCSIKEFKRAESVSTYWHWKRNLSPVLRLNNLLDLVPFVLYNWHQLQEVYTTGLRRARTVYCRLERGEIKRWLVCGLWPRRSDPIGCLSMQVPQLHVQLEIVNLSLGFVQKWSSDLDGMCNNLLRQRYQEVV